jgi:hypothetical protein
LLHARSADSNLRHRTLFDKRRRRAEWPQADILPSGRSKARNYANAWPVSTAAAVEEFKTPASPRRSTISQASGCRMQTATGSDSHCGRITALTGCEP